MAENKAGGIYYDLEINTSQAIQAETQVNKATRNMEKNLQAVDKAAARSGKSMNNLGANAAQLGFQVQDAAVQLQMGTSAFTVLAQQGSQAAMVLGPSGAVVGAILAVTSAVAGALIPTLIQGGETLDEFKEKQKATVEGYNAFISATDKVSKNDAVLSAVGKLNAQYDEQQKIINNANNRIAMYSKELNGSQSQVIAAAGAIAHYKEVIKEAEDRQKELGNSIEDVFNKSLPEATDQTGEAISTLTAFTAALQTQVDTLGMSDRGLALYTAEQIGATQADLDAINAKYDLIEAYRTQQDESKALMAELEEFQKFDEKQRQSRERAKGQAEGFATGVINRGMSEPERFAAELERLTELREQGLLNEDLYNQAVVASAEQRADRLAEIAAQEEMLRQQQNSMILGSASDLFGGIADVMKNAKGEQSSAYKAFFALSKGFAIAQAGLNLSTAISNALALPFPVNIPAMAQAAAAGTSLLSTISGAQYAGAREFGGPVTAGKSYLVGERGPEIFTPGMGGGITSNKDLMGSGGVNVNVYNYGNDNVQVKQNGRDVDIIIKQAVGAVAGQISSGQGPVGKALKGVGVKPSAIGG